MDRPYLQIQTAAGLQQLVLGREPISIGRHRDNQLVLTDDMVSRFHCVIEKAPDGYLLRDLGASNGTLVNGRRVKSAILSPGDVVRVGSTDLVLVLPESELNPVDLDAVAALEQGEIIEQGPETLDESDIVDDTGDGHGGDYVATDEGPIAVTSDDNVDLGGDYEHALRQMAEAAWEKPFGETAITMLNPRGQTMHAGKVAKGGPRPAVEIFRLVLLVCFRNRVTDIHLEPKGDLYQLRLRVDGSMVDAARFPNDVGGRLVGLVKVLSDIDPSQRNIVQEGNFSTRVPAGPTGAGSRRVDYRVSFAPAVYGQKLVIRILDAATAPLTLWDLHLPEEMQQEVAAAIEQDSGMVLVSGPTGSGKTSSLYALLRSIDLQDRNVVTIEDPVEIQIEGATQIPVDDEKGNNFPTLLRSVLRQDPDVILVGEIRDGETARVAMQAAITGHLVFSTVHTKDRLGTVFRLLDLGIEPYLLGQGLQVVLAQRLVRQLCPECKVAQPITPQQASRMGAAAEGVTTLYAPGGCYRCFNTGFAGRRAIFELLRATEAFQDAIMQKPTIEELRKTLSGTGFRRLSETGYKLVAEGVVSFDEIDRTVGR